MYQSKYNEGCFIDGSVPASVELCFRLISFVTYTLIQPMLFSDVTMRVIETKEGCVLEVTVKPRSRNFKVTVEGEDIVVSCTEEPVKGKANKEIIKEFSKMFHRQVELVSGFASREKRLLVKNAKRIEVEEFVKRC